METNRRERQLLIALLSAVEDPARAAELPARDDLVAVARHHRLSPLLLATSGGALPATLAMAFRRDRLVTAARNLALRQVAEECIQTLAAGGIPAIVLKGLAYDQSLFQGTGVRPAADIDLFVPNEKRRPAFEVLDRMGFEPRAAAPGFDDPDYHEVAWSRPGAEVDLHLALAPFARCRIDYAKVWADVQPLRIGQTDALALHPVHAAIFHALHMAIDHFAVPALYLVDLSRLISLAGDVGAVQATARSWHCYRPLDTALALTAAFLPRWRESFPFTTSAAPAKRVVRDYGGLAPLPRPEQLLRKLMHFDALTDAIRYIAVQGRRNVREKAEKHLRRRSARERLALAPRYAACRDSNGE